jgi:hypothetical protein
MIEAGITVDGDTHLRLDMERNMIIATKRFKNGGFDLT